MKDEHIVRRMLDVDIPVKRRRGRPNLRRKYACKIDMTEVGLKQDKTTNRAAKPATPDDATSQGRRIYILFIYIISHRMTLPIRKACCHWIIGTVTDQCPLRHGTSPGHAVTLNTIDDNVVMLCELLQ